MALSKTAASVWQNMLESSAKTATTGVSIEKSTNVFTMSITAAPAHRYDIYFRYLTFLISNGEVFITVVSSLCKNSNITQQPAPHTSRNANVTHRFCEALDTCVTTVSCAIGAKRKGSAIITSGLNINNASSMRFSIRGIFHFDNNIGLPPFGVILTQPMITVNNYLLFFDKFNIWQKRTDLWYNLTGKADTYE
jgi:hypothetical protein